MVWLPWVLSPCTANSVSLHRPISAPYGCRSGVGFEAAASAVESFRLDIPGLNGGRDLRPNFYFVDDCRKSIWRVFLSLGTLIVFQQIDALRGGVLED